MTCHKARSFLERQGVVLELHDLIEQPLSAAELDRLIGDRDYKKFLNPKHPLYYQRKFAQKPPTRSDALKLMAKDPNLIRRPIAIRGHRLVLGYDEARLRELTS